MTSMQRNMDFGDQPIPIPDHNETRILHCLYPEYVESKIPHKAGNYSPTDTASHHRRRGSSSPQSDSDIKKSTSYLIIRPGIGIPRLDRISRSDEFVWTCEFNWLLKTKEAITHVPETKEN
jgi:hypothetical protein